MRVSTLLACALASVMSMGAGCPPTKTPDDATIRAVSFSCKRTADGAKRPNDIDERYELQANRQLVYSAYFYAMPIELNHNDGITWTAGAFGERVLQAARGSIATSRRLGETEPAPACVYVLSIDSPRGSSTLVVEPAQADAWRAIDAPFVAMIAAFEAATKRPMKPHELPQAP